VKSYQLVNALPASHFKQALGGVEEIIKVPKIWHAGRQDKKTRFNILAVVEQANLLTEDVKDVRWSRFREDPEAHAVAHYLATGKRAQIEIYDKRADPAPRNVDGGLDTRQLLMRSAVWTCDGDRRVPHDAVS